MRKLSLILVVSTACTAGAVTSATTTTSEQASSTTLVETTTTIVPKLDECPAAPYEAEFLPVSVDDAGFDPGGLEPDVWTSVGGTQTTFYGRSDGTAAIALIRGTLPPIDWPGEKGETEIDGTRAAVGPHRDGTWVAGWFEEPGDERCNLYTMVFYPPWSSGDVEAVLLGLNRVGG